MWRRLKIVGMATQATKVKARPDGYHTVTPWVISRNAGELIDFMKAAFAAEELGRVDVGGGRIGHAEVRIGDSVLMTFDASPEWPDTPAFIRLYVEDADAAFERAVVAGAIAVTRVAEHVFGDRVGRVRDPQGNVWWLQTHVRDVAPEAMQHPSPAQAETMQDAMSSLDREMCGRVHR